MFKPLNGRVLIKPEETKLAQSAKASGFLISKESDKEKPVIGEVVVGNADVQAGQRVIFSKFGFDEVEIKKEIYYVVSNNTILGIFE